MHAKVQIIRIQLMMTEFRGGGRNVLYRLMFSRTEHLLLYSAGESVLVQFRLQRLKISYK